MCCLLTFSKDFENYFWLNIQGQHKQLLLEASLPNSKKEAYEKTIVTLSSTALLKHQGDITLKDVVTEPQEILALFASKKQQDKGKYFLTTARACSRF